MHSSSPDALVHSRCSFFLSRRTLALIPGFAIGVEFRVCCWLSLAQFPFHLLSRSCNATIRTAYTLELEAEVAKLKEMNEELQKKQEEIMEMQKDQMLETMKRKWGGKRQCLRRTLTGPW